MIKDGVLEVSMPPKLKGVMFAPKRHLFIRGGRGSGKSWAVARALIVRAFSEPTRILCTREVQKSIKQSVHLLLKDQIEALGLGEFFTILEHEIRGINGSTFFFNGLSDQTADSIKSWESIDIVWVEEGQSVSKRSWRILTPTIRAPGSEIWCTYNPELETDETHLMAVVNPAPNTVSVELNYMDNPWFPAVLDDERKHAEVTMRPEEYRHIWLGHCKPAVEGAIYFDEIVKAQAEKRICSVPIDPVLKTHIIFDLGWNDAMSIILAQRSGSEVRVVHYIEDSHRTLADYSADLREMRLNWGSVYLPHDARAKNIQTGRSAEQTMQSLGWDVQITPQDSVENGIRNARMVFPRVYFDEGRTSRLVECLKRYRRQVNATTGEAGAPLHDEHSHGADCFRYLATVADQLTNEAWGGSLAYPKVVLA